jgi:ubiquinone/menaquinone biosynthesis C-methylase UbiE
MPLDHFSAVAPIYAHVKYLKTDIMREVASLPVNGRLLDVGGGTGRVSSAIRGLVDEIVIVDLSFGMLIESPHTILKPVCGGSESLPFADESFDRVIMVDTLHHVIDQTKSAYEMYRVIKPGGLLVIEEPDIRTFGVKLIALAEKLLLMRSHFLDPDDITKLFGSVRSRIKAEDGTIWIIVKKPVTLQA